MSDNMNKNYGVVYINNEGRVTFEFEGVHIEYISFPILTEIIDVVKFDKETGYICLMTNYGEEFYTLIDDITELGCIVELGVAERLKVKEKLKGIDGFKVITLCTSNTKKEGYSMADINKLRDEAYMIMDGIAYIFKKQGDTKYVCAIDLKNVESVAYFVYDKSIGKFNLVQSTFKEGKRKYEMLYFLERNTKRVYEGMKDA